MKKNLKIIVLGAVILSSLTTIAFADSAAQISTTNSLKKTKIEVKQLTKEERIKKLEERIKKLEERTKKLEERTKKLEECIQNLEKKYEEGLISQETYDAKKANFNKMLEKLKNEKEQSSKVDNLKEQKVEIKQLTKKEEIKELEERIQSVEKKYQEGVISKETYDKKIENFNNEIEMYNINEITNDGINSYKVGMNQVTINVNGENRRFKFYVPENLPSEGVSLVFRFHGSTPASTNPNIQNDPTSSITKNYILNKIANDENIIAVYPEGTIQGTQINWTDTERNLGFFDEMLKYFEETFDNIDSNRIYTCGHSSGAIFSYVLAGFREDKIAAAVPVSGQYSLTKNPEKSTFTGNDISVPIRAYNGTNDGIVNHQGAYNNMCVWSEKENKGSSSNIEESSLNIGDYEVNIKKWNGGLSDLEMYSIQDEGHGISWDTIGQSMWEFMKNHPKNK
jgi:poly(3-hydroxybutyrate) depolymerase